MAYLHCHSCDWSQDDFWNWEWTWKIWRYRPFGYNPISLIIDDIRIFINPRYIKFDKYIVKQKCYKLAKIHSWIMLLHEWKRHFKRLFSQKWWTWENWEKHKNTAVCPKCEKHNFDID